MYQLVTDTSDGVEGNRQKLVFVDKHGIEHFLCYVGSYEQRYQESKKDTHDRVNGEVGKIGFV